MAKWTEKLSDKVVDGVYVDSGWGVAGTAWPIGTPTVPVDNLADALVIADSRNLNRIYIAYGTLQLPSDISGYAFIGTDQENAKLDFNNKKVNYGYFEGLWLSGSCLSGSTLFIRDCRITEIVTLGATNAENIVVWGRRIKVVADWTDILIDGGIFEVGTVFDFNSADGSESLLNRVTGDVAVANLNKAGSSLYVFGNGLNLDIQNTCTAGSIYIFGDTKITDESAGTTVEDYTNKPRPETAVNISAIAASETNFLNLDGIVPYWATHYTIDDLVLKCVDPGANTVNVRLYKLVNGVLTNTQTFAITNANFATYFDINTMFGLKSLAGDNIKITVQATGGGPYAVTGSYSYRSA